MLYKLVTLLTSALLVTALVPSQDPFYVPAAGFELEAPGTILKTRPLPSHLRAVILPVNVKNSWQLLVRSTDALGNASAIVTTVMQPYNADPTKFVSYGVAEDSASPDCAVSYGIQVDAPILLTLITQADMLVMQAFLKEGYYVQTADYEGTKGAFTVGFQAAYASLDSIRATLASTNFTGVSPNAKTILYGYSGGSIPSAWGAAYQPKYAPELSANLVGAAYGGFVTDVRAVAEAIEGGVFAGLTADALVGWINTYPGLLEAAKPQLTSPAKLTKLMAAGNQCLIPSIVSYAFQRFFTGDDRYFVNGYGLFDIPYFANIIGLNTLSVSNTGNIPQVPIFTFQSANDEIAPYDSAMRVYNNWCAWGIKSYEFSADELLGHLVEYVTGQPAGFAWVKRVLNGGYTVQGCTHTTRLTNLLYPGAPWNIAVILNAALLSALQQPIGPGKKLSLLIPYSNPLSPFGI